MLNIIGCALLSETIFDMTALPFIPEIVINFLIFNEMVHILLQISIQIIN